TAAGLDSEIWQCPVVFCLPTSAPSGVQGDGRTYGHPIVLRPVSSEDAMTAAGLDSEIWQCPVVFCLPTSAPSGVQGDGRT
ncbi:hypothetical protein D9B95_12380, partial [Corynebacterium diphtheriae]